LKNDSLRVPPSCRLTLLVLWGGHTGFWARVVVRLHLAWCANCRAEKAAWQLLQPILADSEERPSAAAREAVLDASRRVPLSRPRPYPAWRLALAAPALVAVSFLVCVLTKGRPDVGWNGGFAEDLAEVRVRVSALSRSVELSSEGWDGRVRRIRGRIDLIESAVEQETWRKETKL
jgi:hypothetical protein